MQNVGTPRIYVDWGSWLKSIGKFEFLHTGNLWENYGGGIEVFNDIFGLNPSKQTTFNVGDSDPSNGDTRAYVRVSSGCFSDNPDAYPNYMAVLGHNFDSATCRVYPHTGNWATGELTSGGITRTEIINYGSEVGSTFTPYDGFTMFELSDPDFSEDRWKGISFNMVQPYHTTWISENFYPYTDDVKIGSLCYGRFYDFPHSPDLNLTMSIENDGITTQQTKGGSTLTNMRYGGNPKWGENGAWELVDKITDYVQLTDPSFIDENEFLADGSTNPNYNPEGYTGETTYTEIDNPVAKLNARGGRRVWNLTFSYLSDKQVLPINALGNTVFDIANASSYDSTDYTDGGESSYFNSNVLDGEDFFSAVWNRTQGLPFIFQPDKNNANPDQFAICRFDQDSLQVKQVAFNTYTISLKIRECW